MSLNAQGRNFRLMTLFSMMGMFFSFLVGAQTARQFASDMQWLGYQAFFNAIEFPVTLFGANWLNPALIKFINQERQHVSKVLWTNTLLKVTFSGILAVAAIGFAWACGLQRELLWMFSCLLATNILLSCGLSQAFDAFGQGALDARWHAVTQGVYLVSALGLLWGVGIQGPEIWLLSAVELGVTLLYIGGLWAIFHMRVRPLPLSWSFRQAREQIRFGLPLILSGLSEKLSGNLDIVCLKWAGGAEGAVWCAVYSIPQRILRILRQVIGQAFRQFTPTMVKNFHADRALSARTYSMGFRLVGVFALTLWVVLGMNAQALVTVLFSGAYASSAPCLTWLMGGFVFRHLAKVCNNVLIAAGDSRAQAGNQYVVAVAALVLVPSGAFSFGAQGAALAVALTYALSFAQSWKRSKIHYKGFELPRLAHLFLPFALASGGLWLMDLSGLSSAGLLWGEKLWEVLGSPMAGQLARVGVQEHHVREVLVGSAELLPALSLGFLVTVLCLWFAGPFTDGEKSKVGALVAGMLGRRAG